MSSVVTLYGLSELSEERPSTYKVDWLDPKQNVGIEIEVEQGEGVVLSPGSNYWSVKPDGSLRNGREYVLSRPMRGDNLSAAIEEFFANNQTRRSPTAGTHIHIDMRDRRSTMDVVKTMAAIVACIEPAIFTMFAEGRDWCGYTNPMTTLPAQASYPLFCDKATDGEFVSVFNPGTREYKYYGFNMLPLGRYGSVEFRYFNTAETPEELVEWVQFCVAVKLAAVAINTRANLKPYLSSPVGWEDFLTSFFPAWKDRIMEALPFKDAYFRYKKLRNMARKGSKQLKMAVKENKLKSTRFKKFFAVKVVDPTTKKAKLVYDLEELTSMSPVKVWTQYDPAYLNGDPSVLSEGDILVHNNNIYRREQRNGWVDWLYFAGDHVIEERRTPEDMNIDNVIRAFEERINNADNPGVEGMASLTQRPSRIELLGQMAQQIRRRYVTNNEVNAIPSEQPVTDVTGELVTSTAPQTSIAVGGVTTARRNVSF